MRSAGGTSDNALGVADGATGRLLGAHVVAENAGDVIYALAFDTDVAKLSCCAG